MMKIGFAGTVAVLCIATLSIGSGAQAQLTSFTSESAFLTAAGNPSFESFEGVSVRLRSGSPVNVSGFSVTPDAATLGVTDGINSPETTYGTIATEGTKALFLYNPGVPTGTLRFDLTSPSTAFGFNIIDAGEADGKVIIRTNAGESLSDVTLAEYPPTLSDGNVQFLGFTQKTPFTQVFLTVTIVDEAYGLDKIYLQSVPEPGLAMTGLGMCASLGFLIIRRRKR